MVRSGSSEPAYDSAVSTRASFDRDCRGDGVLAGLDGRRYIRKYRPSLFIFLTAFFLKKLCYGTVVIRVTLTLLLVTVDIQLSRYPFLYYL